jgi:hypothetical protein
MTIELSKNVDVFEMSFVGEVDFFQDSPYKELFDHLNSKDELIEELEIRSIPRAAIKNILQKLESLGVLKDGCIGNVEDGFPEKEYGKYTLEYFKNNTPEPFEYMHAKINRKAVVSENLVDNIKRIDSKLLAVIQTKNEKGNFRIIKVENNQSIDTKQKAKELKLLYKDNEWSYVINNSSYEMNEISFNEIFNGSWDDKTDSLKVTFDAVRNNENALKDFKLDMNNRIELNKYGMLEANYKNIPIIPSSENDALLWLLHLLKKDIEEKNRYISKDELKQLWLNLMDRKQKFKKFDLEFDFEKILEKFGKESKYYWLLQTGMDLYPFDDSLAAKSRVVIDAQKDVDLVDDFFDKFHIETPNELIIVDRWIVNLEQFQALEKIIEAFGNPRTTIITQEVKEKKHNKLIETIIERNNIIKIDKNKNDIVHPRYWIFDNKTIYKASESLDFMKINKENIDVTYTSFELYEAKDVDPKLFKMEVK